MTILGQICDKVTCALMVLSKRGVEMVYIKSIPGRGKGSYFCSQSGLSGARKLRHEYRRQAQSCGK